METELSLDIQTALNVGCQEFQLDDALALEILELVCKYMHLDLSRIDA